MLDQITEFFNQYPFLWVVYPVVLVLPIALIVTLLLTPRKQELRLDEPNVTASSSDSSKVTSIKTSKSEQPDSSASNQKKKSKVRYIVRRKDPEDDRTEGTVDDDDSSIDAQQWNFPPTLEEFNLMELEVDPAVIEGLFADERLIQVIVRLSANQGLGLTIVGGRDSANGETPIYVKRILPDSVLQGGKLKSGDQLIAVNDVLLVNATKEDASKVLSNAEGEVRLLVIQDL